MGLKAKIVLIGKKGITYFNRRTDQYDIVGMSCSLGRIVRSLHTCVMSRAFMCNIVSMWMCTTYATGHVRFPCGHFSVLHFWFVIDVN